jgi:hypothetical protein
MNNAKTALIGMLLIPALALAQTQTSRRPPASAANQRAVVESSPKGSAFASEGQQYRVLGGVRAIARAASETEEQALTRASAASTDIIERRGGFLFVRDTRRAAATIATAPATTGAYAVAVNSRTGQLGVVSGIINVRLRRGGDPVALARSYGLELISAASRIRAAFFRAPAGQDLQAVAAAIAKDATVASVEIEVLEHFDVLH